MDQLNKYLVSIDSKNKIRQVQLEVHWDDDVHGFILNRTTGMFGGKLTEQPPITITCGKANRTVTEQARLQFNSKLKEYKDKGYKELEDDPDTYTSDQLREIVGDQATNQAGVMKPMLAKQADKVTNQKIYNKVWYASRKIDGVRMLMYFRDGAIHTASRGGEHYDYSTHHITENPGLVKLFTEHPDLILDGELYRHGKSLQQISGAARMEKNAYDMDWLQYYLYDIVDTTKTFKERLKILMEIRDTLNLQFQPDYDFEEGELPIQFVPHVQVTGWDNMNKLHDQYVSEGWEGLVIRDPEKVYRPNGRTNDMIKIKHYFDDTYKVLGYELGLRGYEDMVFICEMKNGKTFKASPMGSREIKKEYVDNFEKKYKNQFGDCKYFEISEYGIPQQPKFKAFRWDLN